MTSSVSHLGGLIGRAVGGFRSRLKMVTRLLSKVDHQVFKNLMSGIQSLAITVAVIVGGWWAMVAYTAERVDRRSMALFEAGLQSPTGGRWYTMSVEQVSVPDDANHYYIHVELTLLNVVADSLRFRFPADEPPLRVFRYSQNTPMRLVGEYQYNTTEVELEAIRLPRVQSADIEFLVPVDSIGPYIVEFKAPFIYHKVQRYRLLTLQPTGFSQHSGTFRASKIVVVR